MGGVVGVHDDPGGSAEAVLIEDLQQGWETGTSDLPHCSRYPVQLFLFASCRDSGPGSDRTRQETFSGDPVEGGEGRNG